MDNQVDEKIAKAREKEIMQIQKRISLSLNKNRINEIHDVLIEDFDGNNYYGRSYLYAPDAEDGYFIIKSQKNLIIGEYVKVKIINSDAFEYAETKMPEERYDFAFVAIRRGLFEI